MNRHQRRAAAEQKRRAEWSRGMRDVQDDAAGLLDLFIARPVDLIELMARSASSERARNLSALVMRTVLDVYSAPAADPVQCMACCRPLREPDAFSVVLAIPHRDSPRKCVSSAMCPDCGTGMDEIRDRAIEALRNIWPELRRLPMPTVPAGSDRSVRH